jgi:hypothetical protein
MLPLVASLVPDPSGSSLQKGPSPSIFADKLGQAPQSAACPGLWLLAGSREAVLAERPARIDRLC